MVRFSDIIKRQVDAQKEKVSAKQEKLSGETPSPVKIPAKGSRSSTRISKKAPPKIFKKSKGKRETSKVHLSEAIKEGNDKKEKIYKEVETKIDVFRLAQIVREQEKMVESPEALYTDALEKLLSFWEKLEKRETPDFEFLKNIVVSLIANLKNTASILFYLTKKYPPENYLPYHSLNAGIITVALGLGLKWSGERLQDLGLAALLHDAGMVQIPKEFYLKAGLLRRGEKIKVEEHSKNSFEMLKKTQSLSENVLQMVFQHHERLNGQGYPQALKGKNIHPGARIIALADTFEAITHPRLYHKTRSPYDALIELISKKDVEFDRTILKVLMQEITFYPLGTFIELNTGEVAMVERTSKDFPTRPKVRVLISEGGEKLNPPKEINLSQERLLYIQNPISTPVEQSQPG